MIQDLSPMIVNGFTEDTQEAIVDTISIQLSSHLNQLYVIKNTLETSLSTNSFINYWYKKKKQNILKIQENNVQKLLFEAYLIIQDIRRILTGETLTYKLFVTYDLGEAGTTAQFLNVGHAELQNFISYRSNEIVIAENILRKELNNDPSKFHDFSDPYNTAMSYFKHPARGKNIQKFFIPVSAVDVGKYKLYRGTGRKWAIYNRGHIIEAADSAMVQMQQAQIEQDLSIDAYNFKHLFFTSLNLDSVSGFKGGDNQMVQVKANSARLMRYSTIALAIDQVLTIVNMIKIGNDKAKIREKVRALYDSSGQNNNVEAITDENIDKLVEHILKSLKIS